MIQIEPLSTNNFDAYSLDYFDRRQQVQKQYRWLDNRYRAIELPVFIDWGIDKRRSIARDMLGTDRVSFLAFDDGKIVGFISLLTELEGKRMILDALQVAYGYRGKGIGKLLWEEGRKAAKEYGAEEIYISVFSAEDTVEFYRSCGAVETDSPIEKIANATAHDIQMVCRVTQEEENADDFPITMVIE